MGHVLVTKLEDEDSWSPLAALINHCGRFRAAVADEIRDKCRSAVSSSDESLQNVGLTVAIHSGQTMANMGRGDDAYWEQFSADNAVLFRDALRAAASHMPASLYTALNRNVITLEEVLAQADFDLTVIFQQYPLQIYNASWIGFMQVQLYNLFGEAGGDEADRARDNFRTLGEYLNLHPNPPWVRSSVTWHYGSSATDNNLIPGRMLSPAEFLGASTVILIIAESEQESSADIRCRICAPVNFLSCARTLNTERAKVQVRHAMKMPFGEISKDCTGIGQKGELISSEINHSEWRICLSITRSEPIP